MSLAPIISLTGLLPTANAAGDGLNAYYRNDSTDWNDKDLSNPAVTGTCASGKLTNTTVDWSTGSPSGCNADLFSAYYTGYILGPKTGTVNFSGTVDDVLIVRIGSTSVIAKYGAAGSFTGSFAFTSGVVYPIQIFYHENTVGAAIDLKWDASGSAASITSANLGSTPGNLLASQYQTTTCQIGFSSDCPAYSPQEIYNLYGTTTDGNYWIMIGGAPTFQYVLMQRSIDNGGWILSMKGNNTTTYFDYEDTYHWTNSTVENISSIEDPNTYTPARISSSGTGNDGKYESFNGTYAEKIRAVFPEKAAATYGGRYTTNNSYGFMWEEALSSATAHSNSANARSASTCPSLTTATLYTLFSYTRCKFKTPSSSYTAGNSNTTSYDPIGNGLFSSQNQFAWFGTNYTQPSAGGSPNALHDVRFGLAFNENSPNTDEGTNDVTGGIGMTNAASGSRRTGNYYGCCGLNTATNSQFAFEMYVRQADPSLSAPQNLAATAIDSTTVSLSWAAPTSTSPIEYVVQYKPSSGTWTSGVTTVRIIAPSSSPSVIFAGLSYGRSYDYRVYARTLDLTTKLYNTNSSASPASVSLANSFTGTDTAMTFTGSNYLTSSTESPFDVSTGTTFSLSAWVKPNAINSSRIIATKDSQYSIYISNGLFGFNMYGVGSGGGAVGNSITNAPATLNQWQHVELARNGSTLTFYLDGQLVYTDTSLNSGYTITNGSNQFTIGGLASSSQYFSGEIDQVLLSSSDRSGFVQSDMNLYQPSDGNLIAHYDFNEGSGISVFNRLASSTSTTDLTLNSGSNAWTSVESSSINGTYTVVTFTRSYLTSLGGWKAPRESITATVLTVGGGGGGGGAYSPQTSAPGGGGGGGGVYQIPKYTISSASPVTIRIGVGGLGGIKGSSQDGRQGLPGATTTFGLVTAGGGGGGGYKTSGSAFNGLAGLAGGGGGGASNYWYAYDAGTGGTGSNVTINGTVYTGRTGGNGAIYVVGGPNEAGPGGGAGGAAGNGFVGPGITSDVAASGTFVTYGQGGATRGVSGWTFRSTTTTPGWGGDGIYNQDVNGANGADGVVILRYITQTKPIYTAPSTVDTTTAGIKYKFQLISSSYLPLSRSVTWQSSTDTGTSWSVIQTGSSESYTTTTLETMTSGSRYLFRVIVTDSDTAGLSVTDTSTNFYLVINPRNTVTSITGSSNLSQKYGESQTVYFSFAFGTGTRTPSVLSTVNNQNGNITWSNFRTESATVRVGTGLPVGTYYETLTVTDSVTASTSQAIKITIGKADSITVTTTLSSSSVTYTESPANVTVTQTVTGLVNSETGTATTTYTGTTCEYGGSCKIGDVAPGGGYVFYVSATTIDAASGISDGGIYLATAPQTWGGGSIDLNASFGCGGTNISGTSDAVGTGAENTRLINASCATAGIASRLAADSSAEGFTDWFIPSIDELTLIYNNLKVNSLSNLQSLNYWSSTQGSSNLYGKYWWFGSGPASGQTDKNNSAASNMYVRPIRAFSPTALASNTTPTDAGVYRVGSTFAISSPATLSNYQGVESVTATLTINKARQKTITIGQYDAYPGISSYPLNVYGGSGPGTLTRTLVSAGTAGCSLASSFILTATTVGSCTVKAEKAGTRNYIVESTTATIYWINFATNYATQTLGGNHAIPLNGGNQIVVRTETLTASAFSNTSGGAITSASVGTTIRINSTGFAGLTPSNLSVTFKPYEDAVITAVTSTYVEVVIPTGATTGVIIVDSPRGVVYTQSFTISP